MSEPNGPPAAPGYGDAEDSTLGGYFDVHNRPPAFEGPDGHPYTVSQEVEKTGDLRTPYSGYLVFPKWAATGVGIVGHVESPALCHARTRMEVEATLRAHSLVEVQAILDRAVAKAEDPVRQATGDLRSRATEIS